jgi:hypothetical protein
MRLNSMWLGSWARVRSSGWKTQSLAAKRLTPLLQSATHKQWICLWLRGRHSNRPLGRLKHGSTWSRTAVLAFKQAANQSKKCTRQIWRSWAVFRAKTEKTQRQSESSQRSLMTSKRTGL